MLYIWPYIVFFSWPIILPHLLTILSGDLASIRNQLPRPIIALPSLALMAAAVRFNTMIHPFTLADNRHYVFYVFRILLRHPLIKYTAVPVYLISAWAAITALGNSSFSVPSDSKEKAGGAADSTVEEKTDPVRVSFVLVWLVSTTLSVITAPLVEPRYFIIPWLIWRLHVAPPASTPPSKTTQPAPRSGIRKLLRLDPKTWLWIETAWFLLVNLATCYMFLYRGFEWTQEPGRVQRFMW
jgi:alpha-1,2-glucosyltransferase